MAARWYKLLVGNNLCITRKQARYGKDGRDGTVENGKILFYLDNIYRPVGTCSHKNSIFLLIQHQSKSILGG